MAYTLHHGDAIEWLRSQPPGVANALITDPPYSSGGMFRGDRVRDTRDKYINTATKTVAPSFPGDTRDQRGYYRWSVEWMAAAYQALQQGSVIAVFTDWRQCPLVSDALQVAGFIWRGTAVWDKTQGCRPQKGMFRAQAEFVLWGTKGARAWNEYPVCLPGVLRHAPNAGGRKLHQAGKPLGLMRDIVRLVEPGGHLLEPFAGSATTMIAALEHGLEPHGCEMDEYYYRLSQDRLQQEGKDGKA